LKEIEKGIYQSDIGDTRKFIVNLKKEFFEKEPIMKAIHEYSNEFFTSMDSVQEGLVSIIFTPKDSNNYDLNLIKNFSNRVIDYQIRNDLEKEYGHIRDTIVDYAYSPVKKKLN